MLRKALSRASPLATEIQCECIGTESLAHVVMSIVLLCTYARSQVRALCQV